jgi:hypothetical protein
VTRYGESRGDAERRLREALRDREGSLEAAAVAEPGERHRHDLARRRRQRSGHRYQAAVPLRRRLLRAAPGSGSYDCGKFRSPPSTGCSGRSARTMGRAPPDPPQRASGILGLVVRHGALAANPIHEVTTRRARRRPTAGPRVPTIDEAHQLPRVQAASTAPAAAVDPAARTFTVTVGDVQRRPSRSSRPPSPWPRTSNRLGIRMHRRGAGRGRAGGSSSSPTSGGARPIYGRRVSRTGASSWSATSSCTSPFDSSSTRSTPS